MRFIVFCLGIALVFTAYLTILAAIPGSKVKWGRSIFLFVAGWTIAIGSLIG